MTRDTTDVDVLVRSAFASVQCGGVPSEPWVPQVTPPLPLAWPAGPLVYYAYARRMRAGLSDGHEIAEPWARIERGKRLVLMPLADTLRALGTEGIQPATAGEMKLFEEVARAGRLEDLLAAAARDSVAATLVRRHYCHWQAKNLIARVVLPKHPAFVGFLACANVTVLIEPVLPPQPSTLINPVFDHRWPRGPQRLWQVGVTKAFPWEWPVSQRTKLSYYAYALRVEQSRPVPKPREVTEPWGVVVREGCGGAIAFASLKEVPASLGIQQGKTPPAAYWSLLRRMGNDHDEMLVRAGKEAEIAELVRSYYRYWVDDEELLAPTVLSRHPAFAEFLLKA